MKKYVNNLKPIVCGPKVIGLTGGFGTGKSFVATIFKSLGAKIIDADRIAHEAITKDKPVYKKIVASFGKTILDKRGNIDRAKLGALAFANKGKLKRLNDIVHPEVIRFINIRIAGLRRSDIIVIDAPLLVEAGLIGIADKLVVVAASTENQIERCMKKFDISKEDVLKRIAHQLSLKKKVTLADYVIDNDGTRSETRMQVRKVWREIAWK